MEMFIECNSVQEAEFRAWARNNWSHGSDVKTFWHPIVRDEIEKIKAEYPATLEAAENKALAAGFKSAAVDAVMKAWPDQAAEIFTGGLGGTVEAWHHDTLNGCYGFRRWGMYVGVEYDGYIHT